jgi:transposase-like protein
MPTRATRPDSAEKTVRDIRRATWRQYSAEEKIRVVLEGLRGETSIAALFCARSRCGGKVPRQDRAIAL